MAVPTTERRGQVTGADPSHRTVARNHQAESEPYTTRKWKAASLPAGIAAPLGMLGLLGVQFLLGIALNLYGKLPSFGSGMAAMMRTGPLIMAHMMLGMILAVGALLVLATALPQGWAPASCAAAALVGILVAGVGGLLFLMDGQGNGASYLMAVGFLVAVAGYITELGTAR